MLSLVSPEFITALIPPAASTDWERSEGKGETSVASIPFSAQLMAQLKPAIPLPTISTFFMASPEHPIVDRDYYHTCGDEQQSADEPCSPVDSVLFIHILKISQGYKGTAE